MKHRRDDESLAVYKRRKTKDILAATFSSCVSLFLDIELGNTQEVISHIIVASVSFTLVLGFLWVFRKLATMADRDDPWY